LLEISSYVGALNTIAGCAARDTIFKGQIRGVPKHEVNVQVRFIERIFDMAG
jgi:hypothetical protein